MLKILIGCIADDFTGASDAASFLVEGGLNTVLVNGAPDFTAELPATADAIVIALKTRSMPVDDAVGQSLQALRWLRSSGSRQIYIKYCSTFDSTPKGNIGPVCDAALEELGAAYTLLCPSLPVNGRTVKAGRLFVGGVPLDQTHMRNHPLNPMWSSNIPALMEEQSAYTCIVLERDVLSRSKKAVLASIKEIEKLHPRFYIIPDYLTDSDADRIVDLFGELPLLTGGSGLLAALGRRCAPSNHRIAAKCRGVKGKAIIFAGSCSKATQGQVKYYLENGGTGIMLSPDELLSGIQTAEKVWSQVVESGCRDMLIYSQGSAGLPTGGAQESECLESTVAKLAQLAVQNGFSRIIVAGGETSGAVTKVLQWNLFQIGGSIAPGVPVMTPLAAPEARLVLKSGNFGQIDFFRRALEMTGV